MNLIKDRVRNLLEEQGVKDPVLRVDDGSAQALSSLSVVKFIYWFDEIASPLYNCHFHHLSFLS